MIKLLKIKSLDVYHGYVQALRRLSLQANEGELLAIIGGQRGRQEYPFGNTGRPAQAGHRGHIA